MSSKSAPATPRAKPLKRPTQARARFTVQAIFDTYVRIWQRDGWERLSTRGIALEAGVAVGTLYDYFPSKQALHSGYVRYCIESIIEQIERQAVVPKELAWRERLRLLIHLLAGLDEALPWFHPDMLELESLIAERKHQQRAYQDLLGTWQRVFDAATDLPAKPSAQTLEALHLAVWGGRRYAMLVRLEPERMSVWAEEMERFCALALTAA